ncbi:hypothetical protein [Pseudomonas sp.]|uniref:hypothetical protein n=1 Tax=Pseudomonas sp. TaxID=306 RepID=UPI003FD7A406
MNRGYRCVGGPLDGQMPAMSEGVVSFEVPELPSHFDIRHYSRQDEAIPPLMAKFYTYRLQDHPRYGTAWVCQ